MCSNHAAFPALRSSLPTAPRLPGHARATGIFLYNRGVTKHINCNSTQSGLVTITVVIIVHIIKGRDHQDWLVDICRCYYQDVSLYQHVSASLYHHAFKNHLIQVQRKLLQKKYSQSSNEAALEQLQVDLPRLMMKLEKVLKQLGKLLSYHPCITVPAADLSLS